MVYKLHNETTLNLFFFTSNMRQNKIKLGKKNKKIHREGRAH